MWNRAVLLVAALAVALPAFADNSSNSKTTVVKPKTPVPNKNNVETNSFSFGAANPTTMSHGTNSGKASSADYSLNLKNPCKQPHPPASCKQPKPLH
jgi:hypothetical protein